MNSSTTKLVFYISLFLAVLSPTVTETSMIENEGEKSTVEYLTTPVWYVPSVTPSLIKTETDPPRNGFSTESYYYPKPNDMIEIPADNILPDQMHGNSDSDKVSLNFHDAKPPVDLNVDLNDLINPDQN